MSQYEDELPPHIGARLRDALHRQFDEVFGPEYLRKQPEPQPHKEKQNEH